MREMRGKGRGGMRGGMRGEDVREEEEDQLTSEHMSIHHPHMSGKMIASTVRMIPT